MADSTSGFALAAIVGGVVFVYAGIRGVSVLKSVQAVIQGKSPASVAQTQPIGGLNLTAATTAATASAGGSTLAQDVAGTLTSAQITALWLSAGGSSGSSRNATCHALQESGGRTAVTSSNPDGGTNVGLWQLDTKGVGAGHTIAELQDPMTNARITVAATRDGADWSQWATPGC